jgi:hypothetical protein
MPNLKVIYICDYLQFYNSFLEFVNFVSHQQSHPQKLKNCMSLPTLTGKQADGKRMQKLHIPIGKRRFRDL